MTSPLGYAENLELHTAAYYGKLCMIRAILKVGIPSINVPNVDGNTPLMMALYGPVKKIKLEVIKLLLLHGADINMVNKKGDSALHAAVQGVLIGNVSRSCVEKLLENGADIRITNDRGKTATQLVYGEKCKKLRNCLLHYSDRKIEEEGSKSSWKSSLRNQCANVYEIMTNMDKFALTSGLRDTS